MNETVREGQHKRWVGRRLSGRLILAVIAISAFVVFVVQNRRTVRIDLLFWHVNTSIAWALIVAGILGTAAGLLLPRLRRRF
ncbi:MAG TPA: hypothetical protein VH916_14510 [Dehalococcoidia bacterium]